MARILSISENNYRVKVQSGGNITLDTGSNVGEVRITGNLVVQGDYTTVNVSDMRVEDNIIVLNNGEGGAGITEITSGITIDRGTLNNNAEFLFNESVDHYDPYSSDDIAGTFVLQTGNGNKSGLQLSTIAVDTLHNLYFDFKNTLNNLEVINIAADDYSQLVFGDDPYPEPASLPLSTPEDNFIPTKRYIKTYIASGAYTPGVADVDKIFKKQGAIEKSKVQAYITDIKFTIGPESSPGAGDNLRSKIAANGLFVDNINLFEDTITNIAGGGTNLILTSSNNNVQLDAVFNLKDQVSQPLPTSGFTKLFSMSQLTPLDQTPGRTGIFFANTVSGGYSPQYDELVAKRRALLFSILF